MSDGRNLTIWNTKLGCFWLSRPSTWFLSDTRHLCLPGHSIHRGFCSGTVDGTPQHSRTAWPQQFLWWWNRDLPVLVPKRQRKKRKEKKRQKHKLLDRSLWNEKHEYMSSPRLIHILHKLMDPNQFVIVSWKQQSDLCRFSFFLKKKNYLKLICIFDDMTINVVFSHSCVKSFEKWLDSDLAWPQN